LSASQSRKIECLYKRLLILGHWCQKDYIEEELNTAVGTALDEKLAVQQMKVRKKRTDNISLWHEDLCCFAQG
jgi:hypothetical protein